MENDQQQLLVTTTTAALPVVEKPTTATSRIRRVAIVVVSLCLAAAIVVVIALTHSSNSTSPSPASSTLPPLVRRGQVVPPECITQVESGSIITHHLTEHTLAVNGGSRRPVACHPSWLNVKTTTSSINGNYCTQPCMIIEYGNNINVTLSMPEVPAQQGFVAEAGIPYQTSDSQPAGSLSWIVGLANNGDPTWTGYILYWPDDGNAITTQLSGIQPYTPIVLATSGTTASLTSGGKTITLNMAFEPAGTSASMVWGTYTQGTGFTGVPSLSNLPTGPVAYTDFSPTFSITTPGNTCVGWNFAYCSGNSGDTSYATGSCTSAGNCAFWSSPTNAT